MKRSDVTTRTEDWHRLKEQLTHKREGYRTSADGALRRSNYADALVASERCSEVNEVLMLMEQIEFETRPVTKG